MIIFPLNVKYKVKICKKKNYDRNNNDDSNNNNSNILGVRNDCTIFQEIQTFVLRACPT